jgi:hypothetical protein
MYPKRRRGETWKQLIQPHDISDTQINAQYDSLREKVHHKQSHNISVTETDDKTRERRHEDIELFFERNLLCIG